MQTTELVLAHEPIHGPNKNDIVIRLTDIQLHSNITPTSNLEKTVSKSVANNSEGRIFFEDMKSDPIMSIIHNGVVMYTLPFLDQSQLQFMVKKFNSQGKRVFIEKPKKLDIKLGKDSLQFLQSKNGKRVLRGMKK